MTTAVDARIPAGDTTAGGRRSQRTGPRRRLFAKYAAALVGLVSLVLLINGSLNVWFSYGEAKDAAIRLQREKAEATAQRIEEFIAEIEKQIGWTTATQWASSPIEQRRFDFGRLQRQVPAITELIQLDGQGHEQLKVSRLSMDVAGGGAEYSADPRFTEALANKVWFGPVYFRKESEPYMTMAVAQSGRNAGVTVAEVNLKLIWDVITAIKIGKTGYAYVVDDKGRLIAHPDISRVLRNTDLSGLPQVAAARGTSGASAEPAAIVRNLDGHRVLSASAAIPRLGWLVFVEQPIGEALAPLYTTVLNTGLLLVLGLAVAILAGLLLARRMTGPIRALDAGAARIGAGALDHRITVHTGDELEELADRFNTMAADLQSSYADLEKKVEDRTVELKEALDQQTATAEVLGVINSSPGDLAPVFDAILEKATSLCDAPCAIFWAHDGEHFRPAAIHGVPEAFADFLRRHFGALTSRGLDAIKRGEAFVHNIDLVETNAHSTDPLRRAIVDLGRARTGLLVPLHKDGALLGAIRIFRQEIQPFSDKQIALLQNFAAQAVIAMENARLITETREALEQQTATAEVLGVINSSPGDLAPVFDAMLDNATRLCEAVHGTLATYDGEFFRFVAAHGEAGLVEAEQARGLLPPSFGVTWPRLLHGESVVHVTDVMDTDLYRTGHEDARRFVDIGGGRALLTIALRKEDALLGALTVYRQEVRPFSDKQIALLQNFAAQAVIAMENARLITETREALEQRTATAEVLGVINSSPGDLAPVFDAMLDKAANLCAAEAGVLFTYEHEHFEVAAWHGQLTPLRDFLTRGPLRPSPNTGLGSMARERRLVHIADIASRDSYKQRDPLSVASVELGGIRTFMAVPLVKEGSLLGAFTLYRQQVQPFSDKQIALVQNFAAQAVIAMENARLITETREALEQQTATAEVLGVINSSPGDLAPVFDAMLDKAMHLCEAAFGTLWTYDGACVHAAALHNVPPIFAEFLTRAPHQVGPDSAHGRLLRGEPVVHIPDIVAEKAYRLGDPIRRALVELGGGRTLLAVPLRKDNTFLGDFVIYRQEARPFSDKQIALLQNFAAQAVIAMENARLINETREALEQQTATAEVLGVINSSPGDLAPVFDAMLDKALHLCQAASGTLWTFDGEYMLASAVRGAPLQFAEFLRQGPHPAPSVVQQGLLSGEAFQQTPDLMLTDGYRAGEALPRAGADLGGIRTLLGVPLRKDKEILGVFGIYRQEVRPFTDKQIALLQNFAAQAVIAMENARLITETREALEQQTATAEVLGVINSSPGDLAPVFDAMLEKAMRLCEAAFGTLWTFDSDRFQSVAQRGVPDPYADYLAHNAPPAGPGTGRARILQGERFVHVANLKDEEPYRAADPHRRALVDLGGARTGLIVPLRKDDAVIGFVMIYRQEVRLFSDKQIALLQNFAAQAVIAMENARLLGELRGRTRDLQESLEYQTASSDVLKVISRSGAELGPVLDTLVETAARICRADSGFIFRLHDGLCRMAAAFGIPAEYRDFQTRNPIAPGRGTLAGRTVLERRAVHIEDAAADPEYTRVQAVQLGRQRTMLGVPLVREDTLIGVITLARSHVEPFTEKQIALVTTFADQAVIAIENARLFNELRERTTELGRSVEELKMLSEVGRAVSSTLDLRAVLSAILTASLGLTWANAGAIFRYSRADRTFRLAEAVGLDGALVDSIRDLRVREAETAMGEATERRAPIQISDLAERPSAPLRDAALFAGFHSVLIVPLVGAERILGAIILMRQEAGEFPPETVRLMQTLASQSVLAIQNARMFREIADKSEQLALASQHKSQFLANMSHELRTPLNAILGYAELLVDGIYGVLPDRPKGVLERIQNNGRHLLALINDVLDLAKIEAGQLTLTLEDYALAEVVRSVVTATEPLATSKGLKFTAALQDDMPMGHGDARRVSQVLMNLVGNAIKFTEAGEVEIRASVAGGQFVLTVRDTGPGIADADQEQIFGEFQQIDNSNTRSKGGTGLGLAISKRMVEMQGGTILVESVLGEGSTFRVALPVHVDEMMEAAE